MRTLARIGDRLLSNLVPQISAAACIPADHHFECDYVNGSDCSAANKPVLFTCFYNCAGELFCTEQGCCG